MINNNDDNEIKFSDTRAKPTIKVRINPRPNFRTEADLILEALARLNRSVVVLEESFSEFLRHQESAQKYAAMKERERRWL